jgi:hypothetical protein
MLRRLRVRRLGSRKKAAASLAGVSDAMINASSLRNFFIINDFVRGSLYVIVLTSLSGKWLIRSRWAHGHGQRG